MQSKGKARKPPVKRTKNRGKSEAVPRSSHSEVTVVTHANRQGSFKGDLIGLNGSKGERVKVVVRIRPMNAMEKKRNDDHTVEAIDENHIQCAEANKQFRFNAALNDQN